MNYSVSVVLCSYNGEKYVKEQIDSILNQSYPVYELIIQDDCSNDNTMEILMQYESDPRVKIYANPKPLGFNANFLTAILKTSGDYIACSDQDDIWKTDKIKVLINHIKNNNLIFHDSILFTTDISHPLGMRNLPNQNLHETYLLLKPYIPGHQCFFSNKIMPELKYLYDQEPNVSFDSIICLISKSKGGIIYCNEGLIYWRRHSQAVSYIEHPVKIGRIKGFIIACKSLYNKDKRNKTQLYFKLAMTIPLKEISSIQIAENMSTGTLLGLIRACFNCFKYRKVLYPESNISSWIKVFLTPLYFIRDSSEFIIK